jgi:hypothetical protein
MLNLIAIYIPATIKDVRPIAMAVCRTYRLQFINPHGHLERHQRIQARNRESFQTRDGIRRRRLRERLPSPRRQGAQSGCCRLYVFYLWLKVRVNDSPPPATSSCSAISSLSFAFSMFSDIAIFSDIALLPLESPGTPRVDKQQRIASPLWAQVGFSDPATGDFHDATVLRKFGDVPDDLSAL